MVELAAFETAEKLERLVPTISGLFEKLKITNCLSLLIDIITTRSLVLGTHAVARLLELYDVLWNIPPTIKLVFKTMLYELIRMTPKFFGDIKEFLKSAFCRITGKEEEVFEDCLTDIEPQSGLDDEYSGLVGTIKRLFSDAKVFGSNLPHVVTSFFENNKKGLPLVILGWVIALGTLIAGGTAMFNSKSASGIAKVISNLGSTFKGVENIDRGFTFLSEKITDGIATVMGTTIEREKTPRDILVNKVISLSDRVKETIQNFRENPSLFLTDKVKIAGLTESYDEAHDLYKEIATSTVNVQAVYTTLIEIRQNIAEIESRKKQLLASLVGKQLPATLYLYGGPGAGKTKLAEHIMKCLIDDENDVFTSYSRHAADPHWSGYMGQNAVIYDDFNSCKDGTDHMELAKIYTDAAFLPRMVNVNEKGDQFSSKYVIICSNFGCVTQSKVLNMPEILDRRRDLTYFVSNPRYEELKRAGASLETIEAEAYADDFSHLELTEMSPFRTDNGAMTAMDNGRNSLHLLIAAYKKIHRERSAKFTLMVNEKMKSLKDFFGRDLEARVRIDQIQAAEAVLAQMPMPTAPPMSDDDASEASDDIPYQNILAHHDLEFRNQNRGRHGNRFENQLFVPAWYNRRDEHFEAQGKTVFKRTAAILLMGPPGIGKTESVKGSTIPCIDEFTSCDELFLKTVDDVWKTYDSQMPQCVYTCNDETLDAMFIKHFPNDKQKQEAFMRRCETFTFSWKNKHYVLPGTYSQKDFGKHKYDEIVRVEWQNTTTRKTRNISSSVLKEMLFNGLEVEDETITPDFLESLDITAEIEIGLNLSAEEVIKPDYHIELKDIPHIFRPIRGNPAPYMHHLVRIAPLFRMYVGSLDTTMMAFNALKLKVDELPSIGLTFKDKCRYVMIRDEEGHLKVFKAPHIFEDVCVSDDEATKLRNERYKASDRTGYILDQFFSAIHLVIQMGLVFIGVYQYGQKTSVDKRNARIVSRLRPKFESNEYDDIDDHFTDFYTYTGRPHPKSHHNEIRTDQYCGTHHRMDRCHILEMESSRKPVAMMYGEGAERRNTHISPVVFLESEDETRIKKKPARLPAESEDETRVRAKPKRMVDANQVLETCEEEPCAHTVAKPKLFRKTDGKEKFQFQVCLDACAITQGDVIVDNSLMAVREDGRIFNRALMLKGHLGVINAHSVSEKFLVADEKTTWTATVIWKLPKKDLAFFTIQKQAPQFRDLTGYLMSGKNLKSVEGIDGILIVPYKKIVSKSHWKSIRFEDVTECRLKDQDVFGMAYKGHSLGVSYDPIGTTYGDCGSAIIINDTRYVKKLVGIHAGASTVTGFAAILTIENVSQALDHIVPETKEENIVVLKHQQVNLDFEGTLCDMPVVGHLETNEGVVNKQFHPKTSKYYTSPLAFDEKFGHKFEPSVLSTQDNRCVPGCHPYEDAMKKWNNPQPDVDRGLLRKASNEIGQYFADKLLVNGYKINVLTKTEAINGTSQPGSNPIYRQSSPGYPWKHDKTILKKSIFFVQNDTTLLQEIAKNEQGKQLNHAIDSLVCAAKDGKRSAVVFAGSLKDEPLKLKKIYDATKTRSFAASPTDYTIASRQYFHAAAAGITSLHGETPIKIGIDAKSLDFHDLYIWHARVSDHGFDGDFANWDGTIPRVFMEECTNIYNIIYQQCDKKWKPEDDIIRNNLHACVEGPLLSCYNYVVQAPGGNPSGQPQTSMDNCLCNFMLGYYAFAKICERHGRNGSFSAFIQFVVASYFGDDNMYTVAAKYIDIFNFRTFKEEVEKIGFTLTNAAKDGKIIENMNLNEMEFLKRKFVDINGKKFGALLEDSICKMLAHCKRTKTHYFDNDRGVAFDNDTIGDSVRMCVLEACLHGPVFYKEIADHLRNKTREYNIKAIIPSYESALSDSLYEGCTSLTEVTSANMESDKIKPQTLEEISNVQSDKEEKPNVQSALEAVIFDTAIRENVESSTSSAPSSRSFSGKWPLGGFNRRNSHAGVVSTIGASADSTGDSTSCDAGESPGPIFVQAVSSFDDVELELDAASRDTSVRVPTPPIYDERCNQVPHAGLQYVGGIVRVQGQDGWVRLQCRSARDLPLAPECEARGNGHSGAVVNVRVPSGGSQAAGDGVNGTRGREKYHVSLGDLRFERPSIFWRIFLYLCSDPFKRLFTRQLEHRSTDIQQTGSRLHSSSDAPTIPLQKRRKHRVPLQLVIPANRVESNIWKSDNSLQSESCSTNDLRCWKLWPDRSEGSTDVPNGELNGPRMVLQTVPKPVLRKRGKVLLALRTVGRKICDRAKCLRTFVIRVCSKSEYYGPDMFIYHSRGGDDYQHAGPPDWGSRLQLLGNTPERRMVGESRWTNAVWDIQRGIASADALRMDIDSDRDWSTDKRAEYSADIREYSSPERDTSSSRDEHLHSVHSVRENNESTDHVLEAVSARLLYYKRLSSDYTPDICELYRETDGDDVSDGQATEQLEDGEEQVVAASNEQIVAQSATDEPADYCTEAEYFGITDEEVDADMECLMDLFDLEKVYHEEDRDDYARGVMIVENIPDADEYLELMAATKPKEEPLEEDMWVDYNPKGSSRICKDKKKARFIFRIHTGESKKAKKAKVMQFANNHFSLNTAAAAFVPGNVWTGAIGRGIQSRVHKAGAIVGSPTRGSGQASYDLVHQSGTVLGGQGAQAHERGAAIAPGRNIPGSDPSRAIAVINDKVTGGTWGGNHAPIEPKVRVLQDTPVPVAPPRPLRRRALADAASLAEGGAIFRSGNVRTSNPNAISSGIRESTTQTGASSTRNAGILAKPRTSSRGISANPATGSKRVQTHISGDRGMEAAQLGGVRNGSSDGSGLAGIGKFHLGASAIGTTGHVISTGMSNRQASKQQKAQFDFAQGIINQKKAAFGEAGLPAYLAYGNSGGGSSSLAVGQVHSGRTVYGGSLPGNPRSGKYTGSNAQVGSGWGAVI